jgi:hypothetical protein
MGDPLKSALLPLIFRQENGSFDGISHQMAGRVGAVREWVVDRLRRFVGGFA